MILGCWNNEYVRDKVELKGEEMDMNKLKIIPTKGPELIMNRLEIIPACYREKRRQTDRQVKDCEVSLYFGINRG